MNINVIMSQKMVIFQCLPYNWNTSTVVRAQANEVRNSCCFNLKDLFSILCSLLYVLLESSAVFKVGVDGSSNTASVSLSNSGDGFQESKDIEQTLATEESISDFISQVSNLVKYVGMMYFLSVEF